jgi:hypothetical protein
VLAEARLGGQFRNSSFLGFPAKQVWQQSVVGRQIAATSPRAAASFGSVAKEILNSLVRRPVDLTAGAPKEG